MSSFETRAQSPLPSSGPYLATITNNLDPQKMGRVEVALIKGMNFDNGRQGGSFIARYLSPFYGVTSVKHEGTNPKDFNDVQKSYGMWMVPPDIGVTVLVIFVDGDPNQCFWIGCVPDLYQNHMVPGLAAADTELTPGQEDKYDSKYLPVAEFNKKTQDMKNPNVNSFKKPVHPFADRLLEQGLLLDNIRGVTSSSARRDLPSQVFGISTPGPLDKTGKTGKTGYSAATTGPVSRLGGSTFVMDDGDAEGQNELVRIRTRTGHQILMHNSQDLIYIANSKGTAWIEMTSNGKIDIYAHDSVSIHSEEDFNFRADRDINLEAGRNINIAAGGDWQVDTTGNFTINSSRSGTLTFGSSLDIHADGAIKMASSSPLHLKGTSLYVGSDKDTNIVAGTNMFQTAKGNINVKADTSILQTAPIISVNGAPASAGTGPIAASQATGLDTQELPATATSKGWSNGKFYRANNIESIMNRVPMHEPWSQHESINPTQFTPKATDVRVRTGIGTLSRPSVPVSINYDKAPNVQGQPPAPTGDVAKDNMAAFLWMIRVCEGTSGPTGYNTLFTGATFDPESEIFHATNSYTKPFDGIPNLAYKYADHPNIPVTAGINGKGVTSTAAGAYQFLASTWKECKRALNLPDFSPLSQDKAGLYLVKQRRALDDVQAGNFSSAVSKCANVWASLPGNSYGQNPKSFDKVLALYKQAGGTFVA